MKITAKGMFKRLGYERERILNERFISYRKPYGNSFCYIQFDLKDLRACVKRRLNNEWWKLLLYV